MTCVPLLCGIPDSKTPLRQDLAGFGGHSRAAVGLYSIRFERIAEGG